MISFDSESTNLRLPLNVSEFSSCSVKAVQEDSKV